MSVSRPNNRSVGPMPTFTWMSEAPLCAARVAACPSTSPSSQKKAAAITPTATATIARPTMAPPLDVSMLLGASMMASRKGTGTPSPPSQSPRDSLSSGVMCQLLPHLVLSRANTTPHFHRCTTITQTFACPFQVTLSLADALAFLITPHLAAAVSTQSRLAVVYRMRRSCVLSLSRYQNASARVEAVAANPLGYEASILPCAQGPVRISPAREQVLASFAIVQAKVVVRGPVA